MWVKNAENLEDEINLDELTEGLRGLFTGSNFFDIFKPSFYRYSKLMETRNLSFPGINSHSIGYIWAYNGTIIGAPHFDSEENVFFDALFSPIVPKPDFLVHQAPIWKTTDRPTPRAKARGT